MSCSRESSWPRDKPKSPALQAAPQGKLQGPLKQPVHLGWLSSGLSAQAKLSSASFSHFWLPTIGSRLPWCLSGKEPAGQCRRHKRHRFDPWVGKNLWRRKWQPTPLFLPEKSHGQRSLAGYGPRGHKTDDFTAKQQQQTTGSTGVRSVIVP